MYFFEINIHTLFCLIPVSTGFSDFAKSWWQCSSNQEHVWPGCKPDDTVKGNCNWCVIYILNETEMND